ncbi:MAG: cytochrome b, partial [Caulobacterales bacterium]|nr:cytochrome b [Caulobacterales bacterium]
MSARAESERYTSVAIALHWAIALSIVGLIIAGLWMAQEDVEPTPLHFAVYQMHKSFGVAVLFLTVARLGWRAVNPPPPLPEGMSGFERTASHVVHWAFYGLMLALPVSGWAMVSASPTGVPTLLFNAVPWPHLPIPASEATEHTLKNAHELMAYGAGALIALHVAAACKHQFLARDGLIARM